MSAIILTANTAELAYAEDKLPAHGGIAKVIAKVLGNWKVVLERDEDGTMWVRSYMNNELKGSSPYMRPFRM